MLKVSHISKYYGKNTAIEDISFSAEAGEAVGLVGHNGSGKSTTMGIMTDCVHPDSGEVCLNGICVQENPKAAKKQIGYLPEIPPLYMDMTVDEELSFACGLKGLPRKAYPEEIERVCEAVHIGGVRKRLIRNLSKGYRQRVGFAQALIGSPALLVLDEPTVGLDPTQIVEIRDLIRRLRRNHTILLSSHILSEIAMTCDQIVVLSNGHLTANDTPKNLVRQVTGGDTLLLEAEGEQAEVLEAVRAVPGVLDVSWEEALEEGRGQYRIRTAPEADIHRALFYALAGRNLPIRRLQPVEADLEEIFIQLTRDQRSR